MKPFVTTWDTNLNCTGSTQLRILVQHELKSKVQTETETETEIQTVSGEPKLNAVP